MKNKKDKIAKEIKIVRKEWKNILFNLSFALLTLIITSLFYENIVLTTILLGALTIVGMIKWKSWLTFSIFIFGMLWGPIAEMIAISFGVWQYTFVSVFNVPLWLFILWGDAAAFLFETAMEIKKFGVKDN